MHVIHFTHSATDPLKSFSAKGAHFVPLADDGGRTHISCLHLEKGARIPAPSITHAATLLVVHGRLTVSTHVKAHIRILAGIGAVLNNHVPYEIESDSGAIVVTVEAVQLIPNARRISTPDRNRRPDVAK